MRLRLRTVGFGECPAIHDWHPHVEQDQIDRLMRKAVERGGAVFSRRDTIALPAQSNLDELANVDLVVDDQDVLTISCRRHPHRS